MPPTEPAPAASGHVPASGAARRHRFLVAAAFATVFVVWGSNFLVVKVLVAAVPPLFAAGLRALTGGVILFAWALARGERLPNARQWAGGIGAGALMFFLGHGTLFWAEQRIASGIAAVLVATIPLWVALLGLLRGERVTWRGAAGLLLGIAGVAWLRIPSGGAVTMDGAATAALLVGALAWAVAIVWYRGDRRPASRTHAAALPLLGGGVLLLLASAVLESPAQLTMAVVTPTVVGCFVYLVFLGSIVTFSAFTWLLEVVPATTVSSYAYVNPVVAIALGWSIGHEPYEATMLVPAALVVAGVALIVLQGSRAQAR